MEHSYRFFENKNCEYYPCHPNMENINCLFCYCPLYSLEHCPGNYEYIDVQGKQIKSCMDCTFPHEAKNYDVIIKILSR
jgi:Zn-finger protein